MASRFDSAGASGSGGTIINAGGINIKGSWMTLMASVPYDAMGFEVELLQAPNNADYLVDIALASGTDIIVNNLICSRATLVSVAKYRFMRPLKKGNAVSARCQGSNGASITAIFRTLAASEFLPGAFGEIVTFGASTADSGGTSVDPGATINTKGAWAEITASPIGRALKYLVVATANANQDARTGADLLCDVGIGASGSQRVLIPDLGMNCGTSRPIIPLVHGPYVVDIPAGSHLWARGASSTNGGDRAFDVILYGGT